MYQLSLTFSSVSKGKATLADGCIFEEDHTVMYPSTAAPKQWGLHEGRQLTSAHCHLFLTYF